MRGRAAFFVALAVGAQSCKCEKDRPAPTPTPRAGAGPAPAAPEGAAVLIGSRGGVELQRGSKPWEPAAAGARLGESDALRTPDEAEAELSVDGVRVKLNDRSEIRLSAAASGVLRGRVRGRVESEVKKGKGRVSLQVEDGPIAESSGGHFFLTAEERNVAVAATSGTVQVASGGKTVNVRKGQVSRVESKGKVQQPPPRSGACSST